MCAEDQSSVPSTASHQLGTPAPAGGERGESDALFCPPKALHSHAQTHTHTNKKNQSFRKRLLASLSRVPFSYSALSLAGQRVNDLPLLVHTRRDAKVVPDGRSASSLAVRAPRPLARPAPRRLFTPRRSLVLPRARPRQPLIGQSDAKSRADWPQQQRRG